MRKKVFLAAGMSTLLVAFLFIGKSVIKAETSKTTVGIMGEYYSNSQEALDYINGIRFEACKEGYPNPNDPTKALTLKDFVPLKWSSDMEQIARIRSKEASVRVGHVRPNGESCFTVKSDNDLKSQAETLAWNYRGDMITGIEMWYGEKDRWVKKKTQSGTGHYTIMINPKYRYVGLGCFKSENGAFGIAVCAEFSKSKDSLNTDMGKSTQKSLHKISVLKSYIKDEKLSLSKKSNYKVGNVVKCNIKAVVSVDGYEAKVRLLGKSKIKSSKSKVAKATSGSPSKFKIKKKGATTIKVTTDTGKTFSTKIKVK